MKNRVLKIYEGATCDGYIYLSGSTNDDHICLIIGYDLYYVYSNVDWPPQIIGRKLVARLENDSILEVFNSIEEFDKICEISKINEDLALDIISKNLKIKNLLVKNGYKI